MFKQTILSVLFVIAILVAYSVNATALPTFSFTKLFESDVNKRAAFTPNVCCLPNTFSMKGTFNQVSLVATNNTLQTVEGTLNISGDYNTGRIRQDATFTVDGTVYSTSFLEIKVSSTNTVSYHLQNGKCQCFQSKYNWDAFCIPSSGKISKGKIGAYEAAKVTDTQHGSTSSMWLFKEPQMNSDKCWILSVFVLASNTAAQEQNYYDMVEKVDPNAFVIPSQCPSINSCLAY